MISPEPDDDGNTAARLELRSRASGLAPELRQWLQRPCITSRLAPFHSLDSLAGQWTVDPVRVAERHVFVVRDVLGERSVGAIKLDESDVAYLVDPAVWGQGFGQAALALFCDGPARSLGRDFVRALTMCDNLASQRVLERNRFESSGVVVLRTKHGTATAIRYGREL